MARCFRHLIYSSTIGKVELNFTRKITSKTTGLGNIKLEKVVDLSTTKEEVDKLDKS